MYKTDSLIKLVVVLHALLPYMCLLHSERSYLQALGYQDPVWLTYVRNICLELSSEMLATVHTQKKRLKMVGRQEFSILTTKRVSFC